MKGELSENDLKYKAEAYCSSMERFKMDKKSMTETIGNMVRNIEN